MATAVGGGGRGGVCIPTYKVSQDLMYAFQATGGKRKGKGTSLLCKSCGRNKRTVKSVAECI